MKTKKKDRIHELMLNEISEKSFFSGLVFSLYALIVFFYGLGLIQYKSELRLACGGVLVAAILRFMSSKSSRENHFRYWFKLRAAVWLNAICWSAIFSMVALELNFLGIHSVIAIAIMTNMLTGSVVTLSCDKWLFFPFHVIMISPLLIISLIRASQDPNNFILVGVFLFMLLFIIGLSFEYRRVLFKRFAVQLELEDSLVLLKDQTTQLVQNSKLAALGEMAAGVAHEINNPLAIITLLVKRIDAILKQEPPDLSQMGKFLGEIDVTILRISRIIRGLRNVSREADDEEMREVKISDIFDDVFGICSEKFRRSNITLELKDENKLQQEMLRCQRVQVSQILINLLSNAFDAAQDSPGAKWVLVSLKKDESSLLIEVSNSGPLISEEVKKKMFQPFFTTKEIGKGTGLGLNISYKIAEAHGGDITLKDHCANTTFVVRLSLKSSSLKDS